MQPLEMGVEDADVGGGRWRENRERKGGAVREGRMQRERVRQEKRGRVRTRTTRREKKGGMAKRGQRER